MSLDATVGGANTNAYIDRTNADAYFADHVFDDAWNNAVNADKESALIMATARIDFYDYIGQKNTTTQALKWPRVNTDLSLIRSYPTSIHPPPIQKATCEMALYILQVGQIQGGGTPGAVKNLKIGSSVQVEYATGIPVIDSTTDYSKLPANAARFLTGLRIPTAIA